jgi:hypothetical protein
MKSVMYGLHESLRQQGIHRHRPDVVADDAEAFYGILFRHQHRPLLRQVRRSETVMIRKRMRLDRKPVFGQRVEKSLGVADSGDSLRLHAPECFQGFQFA